MAEKVKFINLLPNKGSGVLDQFFNWALTIGRLLIILTETLALGTFLYRFSLDMRITDLHDLIKNQSAIVKQFKSTEETARSLQTRIAFAEKSGADSETSPDVFSDIIGMGRGIVTFKSVLVAKDGVQIEIQASNTNSLSFFANELKKYPKLTSVSVNKVENKTSAGLVIMNISAKLKQSKTEQDPDIQTPDPGNINP